MEFTQYVRVPFVVEAVMITVDNIDQCAQYIGDLKYKDDGSPYILVDRRLVPNLKTVWPGFYMTRIDDHIRCFSRRVFKEQFIQHNSDLQEWLDFIKKSTEA